MMMMPMTTATTMTQQNLNKIQNTQDDFKFNCIAIDGMTQIIEGKMHKQIVCRSTLLRPEYSHSAQHKHRAQYHQQQQQPEKVHHLKETNRRRFSTTNCNDFAFFIDLFFLFGSFFTRPSA